MSKGLEALKRIKSRYNDRVCIDILEDFDLIETTLKDYERRLKLAKEYQDVNNVAKRLKALEIIKNKKVQVAYLHSMWDDFETTFNNNDEDVRWLYNEGIEKDEQLTKEEYDLLKEVLL